MQTLRKSAASSRVAAARPSRSAVVVRASAESRRAVLSGLIAGVAFTAAKSAQAVSDVDLFDDRTARDRGFDIIYEARDLALPQNERDGMTQARTNLEDTKKRVKASEARIDSSLEGFVSKAYWTEAREELRRQVGTLRFDLNTLASSLEKGARKEALAKRNDFLASVEALDLAIRKKDRDSALAKLESAKSALDTVLAAVL